MLSKRLSLIIISIILGLSLIAGITTAIVVTQPKFDAYIGTEEDVSIGNILTDAGDKINGSTFSILLDKIGAIGSVNGQQKASEMNGGSPVIFQMGEVNGSPIYWQVVYRTKDYITVWMCEPYLSSVYNNSSTFVAYSSSTLRTNVNNIYTTLSTNFPILSLTTNNGIIATPSIMQNATNTTWQSSGQSNGYFVTSGSTIYRSTDNNLSGNALNDGFWIPSYYEVYNTSSSTITNNSTTDYIGLWGVNSTIRAVDGNRYNGSSGTASTFWLRSGYSRYDTYALRLLNSGEADESPVNNSGNARPAAHLSLMSMNNLCSYVINENENNKEISGGSIEITSSYNNADHYLIGSKVIIKLIPDLNKLPILKMNGEQVILSRSINYWYYEFNVEKDIIYEYNFVPWIEVSLDMVSGDLGEILFSDSLDVASLYGAISIQPQAGMYISEFSFDGVTYYAIDSWEALVTVGAPFCSNIRYTASTSGLVGFSFNFLFMPYFSTDIIHLHLRLTDTPYTSLKTSSSVTGVAVTATYGGSVTLIGNDFANMNDNDYITCVAKLCVSGYKFDGWYNANDMATCLSTSESTNFTKAQIEDSQIVAVFEPINNGNISDDINNV